MLMAPATHGLLGGGFKPIFTVAPFITGNTAGGGSCYTTDTLSVSFTVTGSPTISYLWLINGVGASTGPSISAAGMSPGFTTAACTVTATNAAGTTQATTPAVTCIG